MARVPASLLRLWTAARESDRASLRPWPFLWSLLATGLFFISTTSSWPELWQGMLLAIPLLIATVGWGWRAGLLLMPLGGLVLWLSQEVTSHVQPPIYYLGFMAVCALGVLGGQSIYRLWRDSERRARHHTKQAQFLAKAVLELQKVGSASELYAALPQLLAEILAFSHAEVFVPGKAGSLRLVAHHRWSIYENFAVPLTCVCGRAYLQKTWQYVPDSRFDENFMQAPNAPTIRSELAIPLLLAGEVAAVLNLEHSLPNAFDAQDQKVLQAFAKTAETSLFRLHTLGQLEKQIAERGFAAHLNRQLLLVHNAEEAAQRVIEVLTQTLRLETASVLILKEGGFHPLALVGPRHEGVTRLLAQGLPWRRGQLYESWRHKQAVFISDYQNSPVADDHYRTLGAKAIAIIPVLNSHAEVQALLELPCFERPRQWADEERLLLSNVADALGLALERTSRSAQLREMLEVIRGLAQADDPSKLYQGAVEAATRLVPNCEAASLLVRTLGGFKFRGAVGLDKQALERLPALGEASQLRWYGDAESRYLSGAPRIVRGVQVWAQSLASRGDEVAYKDFDRAGNLSGIRSNICVPITHQQEVLGILNLDNLTREDAFGQSELGLAEAFGQQIAVIIRQAQYREALERSVITDTLTGLGNRAGFNRHLALELATARRYQQPFSLLLLDLNRFKRINDRSGHQAGDEALIKVAQALRQTRRESDNIYRWGGDEFALLLPKTDRQSAQLAAQRYAEAIAGLRMGDVRLDASIGIASFPEDGDSSEALLQHADMRLYQHKAAA